MGFTTISRRSLFVQMTPSLRFPWHNAQRRRGQNAHKTHILGSTVSLDGPPSATTRSASVPLPPLRCPGGPRLKSDALKQLFKVPHAGYLAKYDQRFIINLKLTHQIITTLAQTSFRTPDKLLIELGPGAGSLTRSLLTRPCLGVFGIEMDERFNPHLEQIRILTKDKFRWMNADILKLNELDALRHHFPEFCRQNLRKKPDGADDKTGGPRRAEEAGDEAAFAPLRSRAREAALRGRRARWGFEQTPHGPPRGHREPISPNPALDITEAWWANGEAKLEVLANLPFNLIGEVLLRYAVDCSRRAGLFAFGRVPLHVFAQNEIAQRLTARPGSLDFSRLSVLCQAYFHVRTVRVFQEWTYYPRTAVLGALLSLEPRAQALDGGEGLDGAALWHFVNLLMGPGKRGWGIYKALRGFLPDEVVQHLLQESRMDGATTVLHLTVEELVKMAGMWRRFLIASQQHTASTG
ncbi:unnamed protein product [Phytomonas sp. Hart1]|nr:unnamed protein product [Phytomonas sp. Hart1]|eukprot:CCW71927.1 unnamed protein product [Phytomonas sp. isolate Hart1]